MRNTNGIVTIVEKTFTSELVAKSFRARMENVFGYDSYVEKRGSNYIIITRK